MKRLIVDLSSVLWQSLLVGKDEEFGRKVMFEGKEHHINGWQFGYECAVNHLVSVLKELNMSPCDMILVVEGQMAKARRRAIYNGYKAGRDKPEESYAEFNILKEKLVAALAACGASVVTQDGVEADDVIAYLVRKLPLLDTKIVRSNDGDMTTLLDVPGTWLYTGHKGLTQDNKYGPFPAKHVPVYKALVGDGDEYKGAFKFGAKAFLDLLVWGGDGALPALAGVIARRQLHELECDVAEFKPMRKIIDSAEHVYQSYDCALLHDEWVNTPRQPLRIIPSTPGPVDDERLRQWANTSANLSWWDEAHPVKAPVQKKFVVYDCELIGDKNPVFLVCTKVVGDEGERRSFWYHRDGDMVALKEYLLREDLTFVSFNGLHFDQPLVSAAIAGKPLTMLKQMAQDLISGAVSSWDISDRYNYDTIKFDHIDLFNVAPGVGISLKTYAGRMAYPTMVDLPFEHDQDLNEDECAVLEHYCQNDLGVTEALFDKLKVEIDLRYELGAEHGIDLRSKSDAQVAEAILRKVASIKAKSAVPPAFVTYKAPEFIRTESPVIQDVIEQIEAHRFVVHPANGQVVSPDFLDEPIELGFGRYQMGVGGLHSTHDKKQHIVATEEMLVSDIDVASYYPNIMLKAGLTPRLDGGAGERFIAEYRKMYEQRLEAKRAGNKKVANALKISLNGTFGKLGSPYCAFYSPDLMLAVTLTGQLNLMCLIYDLEFRPDIKVISANTDGIMVQYPASQRQRVLNVVQANCRRTGFEYEETAYRVVAAKDVNNYIAITDGRVPVVITPDGIFDDKAKAGVAKRKGLYASNRQEENPLYLMKNPTMEVCSNLAVDYLRDGIHPREAILRYQDIRDYVAIRGVRGGGVQYESVDLVDDWQLVKDVGTKDNEWRRPHWEDGRVVKRKSRPKPVEIGRNGVPFGRVARWYMSTANVGPISYAGSGNKVPKTDGARICMTLPSSLPLDLDVKWYVDEALAILADLGVTVPGEEVVERDEEVVTEEETV